MGIFDRIIKKPAQPVEERQVHLGGLNFNSFSTFSQDQSLTLSAVYCAVNQISNSIALLPINIVEVKDGAKRTIAHPLWEVLNMKVDNKYNHYDFFKQIATSVLLKGNGYALIDRDANLNIKSLRYVDSAYVTPQIMVDGSVKYIVAGLREAVDAINMLDFHMHLDNQFKGVSVIKYAAQSLKGASDAEKQAGSFFSSGGNVSGVLKSNAPLTNEQKKQIAESWRGTFMEGNSSGRPSVAVLPQGVEYQAISLDSADLELLSSRQFNVMEIARWFCIPPSKLMVMDDVSYNSLEMAQISYLQDTILPYTQMMEDEMNNKLFKPSQRAKLKVDFDYSTMLSTNKETEANYYKTLLVNGILSLNEVRNKLGFSNVDGEIGDKHWLQISYARMEDIAAGLYAKDKSPKTDNNIDTQ